MAEIIPLKLNIEQSQDTKTNKPIIEGNPPIHPTAPGTGGGNGGDGVLWEAVRELRIGLGTITDKSDKLESGQEAIKGRLRQAWTGIGGAMLLGAAALAALFYFVDAKTSDLYIKIDKESDNLDQKMAINKDLINGHFRILSDKISLNKDFLIERTEKISDDINKNNNNMNDTLGEMKSLIIRYLSGKR